MQRRNLSHTNDNWFYFWIQYNSNGTLQSHTSQLSQNRLESGAAKNILLNLNRLQEIVT